MQPQLGGLAYLYTFSEATFLTNGPDYICTYVYDTKAQIAAELQYLENGTTLPMRALQVCREPHELIFPLTVESEKKGRVMGWLHSAKRRPLFRQVLWVSPRYIPDF